MKIATWNINSIKVRLPQVLQWSAKAKPDIIALQETKSIDENFPKDDIEAAGYHVIFSGQKTYNGVAIISKRPMSEVLTDIPRFDDYQRRILVATINHVRVINLYVPNGQEVSSDKYTYKLDWLKHITAFIKKQLSKYSQLVVLGDFNIAPEDRDVYNPKLWEGKVLCSQPERKAFQSILKLGLHDSFRLFDQPEKSYTWWDYRMLGFRRNHGLRLDHILLCDKLSKRCKHCTIDKEPRKWERPSDHAPVIAEFK